MEPCLVREITPDKSGYEPCGQASSTLFAASLDSCIHQACKIDRRISHESESRIL